METTTQIIWGILIVVMIIVICKSIIIPGARQIQIIVIWKRVYDVICNVPGKKINKIKTDQHEKWDLVDLDPGEKAGWNIHFLLWPICRVYKYQFAYTKLKKIGEEEPGDIVVWKNETTKECVVSRKGRSDHVEYRVEYPIITPSLDTGGDNNELATVNTFTMNVIESVNVVRMLFGISNWFSLTIESLNGTFRGIVARKTIPSLNKLSSEDFPEFNESACAANLDRPNHPGLLTFGVKVIKSVFKDFEPADENAKKLMQSYTNVQISEQDGIAALKKQEGETKAFLNKTNAEIDQEKKKRVETGQAKVDADGKITELVPEANIRIVAENMGKLSALTGTLVLGGETANMLNLKKDGGNK